MLSALGSVATEANEAGSDAKTSRKNSDSGSSFDWVTRENTPTSSQHSLESVVLVGQQKRSVSGEKAKTVSTADELASLLAVVAGLEAEVHDDDDDDLFAKKTKPPSSKTTTAPNRELFVVVSPSNEDGFATELGLLDIDLDAADEGSGVVFASLQEEDDLRRLLAGESEDTPERRTLPFLDDDDDDGDAKREGLFGPGPKVGPALARSEGRVGPPVATPDSDGNNGDANDDDGNSDEDDDYSFVMLVNGGAAAPAKPKPPLPSKSKPPIASKPTKPSIAAKPTAGHTATTVVSTKPAIPTKPPIAPKIGVPSMSLQQRPTLATKPRTSTKPGTVAKPPTAAKPSPPIAKKPMLAASDVVTRATRALLGTGTATPRLEFTRESSSEDESDDDEDSSGNAVARKTQPQATEEPLPPGHREVILERGFRREALGVDISVLVAEKDAKRKGVTVTVKTVKPGSLGQRGGLEPGDKITRINGISTDVIYFRDQCLELFRESTVRLVVCSARPMSPGDDLPPAVIVAAPSGPRIVVVAPEVTTRSVRTYLALTIARDDAATPLGCEVRLREGSEGKIEVVVASVAKNGPASTAGLLPEDKILSINGRQVEDLPSGSAGRIYLFRLLGAGGNVTLEIMRDVAVRGIVDPSGNFTPVEKVEGSAGFAFRAMGTDV